MRLSGIFASYKGSFKGAGDALVVENNMLAIVNPQYTLDLEEAKNSIKKLAGYDIERVICYHGGIYSGNIREALERIL